MFLSEGQCIVDLYRPDFEKDWKKDLHSDENAEEFRMKRPYVLGKTQGRFTLNALAFESKRLGVFESRFEVALFEGKYNKRRKATHRIG